MPASRTIAPWCQLALLAGCTAHGEPEPAPTPDPTPAPEPPPEPTTVEDPPEPEPWACVRHGPTTPLRHKPHDGAIGDVDGDGRPDVVALSYVDGAETALVVLTGGPDGTFVEGEPLRVRGSGIELGDLDGDGDLDALILDARRAPAYRIADNDGAGTFTVGPSVRIPGRFGGELDQATVADLDGDGDLDVVVPLWDSLRVLNNRGRGRLSPGQRLPVGRDAFTTAVADLDEDGWVDLLSTSGAEVAHDRDSYVSAGSLWFHRGGPRGFSSPKTVDVPGASTVIVADLEGDAGLEVAVSRSWGLTVFGNPRGWLRRDSLPSVAEEGPRAEPRPHARFQVGTDGPLLATDLGPPLGLELITPSYMQGRLNIAGGPEDRPPSSIEAGSFVVELFAADLSRDGTLPDVVLLEAGPPGEPWGEPAPAISVLFVDCAAER